ncbi:sec1 family domain-containing protein 2-like [Zophobas morio]|uniref:sec1 family domain-containing protein 2-like n=1 Tax=Zophobas morio TaxID=2755281 RepID=UPI0030833C74
MGTLAKLIGEEYNSMQSKALRDGSPNCSLVLVDRSFDFCAAVGHHSQSLLDDLFNSLPARTGHVDVHVDVSHAYSGDKKVGPIDSGRIFHAKSKQNGWLIDSLGRQERRESLLLLKEKALECLEKEHIKVPANLVSQPTTELFNFLLSAFSKSSFSVLRKNTEFIELLAGTKLALNFFKKSQWAEKFTSEKASISYKIL